MIFTLDKQMTVTYYCMPRNGMVLNEELLGNVTRLLGSSSLPPARDPSATAPPHFVSPNSAPAQHKKQYFKCDAQTDVQYHFSSTEWRDFTNNQPKK